MNSTENTLAEQKIGDIVAKNFHAAGVFRKYNIDFCCGGGISLQKASEKRGVDVAEIEAEIKQIMEKPDQSGEKYSTWSASFLIEYILNTHHAFVRSKLDEIGFYAQKVAKVHGEHYPENIRIAELFEEISKEMVSHMASEENRVFPLIKTIEKLTSTRKEVPVELISELKTELELMENEHEAAGGIMKEIRALSHDYNPPADACTTYRILYKNLEAFEQDLHKHVHLENNILFKKAEMWID